MPELTGLRPSVDSVFDGPVFFVDDNHGWVGGGLISPSVEGWIHRTTDGGATWSGRLLDGPLPIREILFLSPSMGWAAGGNIYTNVGGIYFSSDGGQTWSLDLNANGNEMDACDTQPVGGGYQVWCAGYNSACATYNNPSCMGTVYGVQGAATPTFSPAAGTYTSPQSATIADTTTGATIYYTTDGTTPTANSTPYAGAITVSSSETIQAITVATGYSNSLVASATYTINLPPADFSLAVAPASLAISSGQPGKTTVTVTPQNGFASAVLFSCSGLPFGALCSFSPTTLTPSGAAATTTLTVSKTAAASSVARRNSRPLFPGAALVIGLCCLGWGKRRRVRLLLAVCVCGLGLIAGCGSGGGGSSTPPPPSTVTVTAASGGLQHTATFSLTVQ